MQDYEKLGAFYLGRTESRDKEDAGTTTVLYDSRDLTTHAVIIGMTGSGKTGLGVGLIEEAALDAVPVIAIDPKGDLGNLLLTFPALAAADFEPWVDAQQATTQGQTAAEFAGAQAALWKQGLADWKQDGARIQRLKDAAEFAIFTPGSSAGIPISVLGSFAAPAPALRDDIEAFAERIQATATSILTLLDMDADPLTSPAHILISNILQHTWQAGGSLDLAGLIGAIQNPPIDKIGVMDLESIYPAKDRFALAMQLNNVLASPGFSAWTQGVPLSAQGLLHTAEGKPRVSIVSIAHLSDTERMFFVTLLLNDIIAWMRAQSGTSSLRALVYMDELFGYMPPTANPPSKKLFLTLLKQARAYGLGLVLSTQNPVDLDYKGLSNTGTWFIGRLQTERDKARVLDGLEGAGSGGGGPFDRGAMERTLAGLGKRKFLLHNVHESNPVVFSTRWVLSYLPGPLTRDQIRRLSAQVRMPAIPAATAAGSKAPAAAAPPAAAATLRTQPVLAPGIRQFYCPAADGDGSLVYYPQIAGAADVLYTSKTHSVDTRRDFLAAVDIDDGPMALDWRNSTVLQMAFTELTERPLAGAAFADVPGPARDTGSYKKWASGFKTWLRQSQGITLYKSKPYKLTSVVDENETDFRIRVQQAAREQRDLAVGKLRGRYEEKAGGLHDELADAERDIAAEKAQAKQKTVESALSIGGALLGAFLGRKTVSAINARRIGTAARRAGTLVKERRDVHDAETRAADLRAEIDEAAKAFESELAALQTLPAAGALELTPVTVRAKNSDITVRFVALLWLPYRRVADGRTTPAWKQTEQS